MEKITVAELATECSVKNQVVLAELKRLGLYVFSPTATIDVNFAETIRKKILSQREAEEAKASEAERKKEAEAAKKKTDKKSEKKTAKKPTRKAKTAAAEATAPAEAPRPRKRKRQTKAEKIAEEEKAAAAAAPKVSLAPRKGRKHYDREADELVDIVPKPAEKPVEPAPEEAPVEGVSPAVPLEAIEAASIPMTPAVSEPVPAEAGIPPEKAPSPDQRPAPAVEPSLEPSQVVGRPSEISEPIEAAPPGKRPARIEKEAEPKAPPVIVAKKKFVVPKAKTKILMRTSTEKVVTPEITERILRGLREERQVTTKFVSPARPTKKKKAGKALVPERAAKVVELPRPPASPEEFKPISITEGVTIKELAEKMDIRSKYIIQKLISKGILASINQALDLEAAKDVCAEFGFRADVISFEQEAEAKQEVADKPEDHVPRPPVVTIMGHVDHGKTSLLDKIRETNVTATEAGGITQHIGAYLVEVRDRSIAFLDTPGHEAFTMMRARGAQATDIVVLVVAADDGVMPQTIEAIHHAKAANVPIIVAINKIDKPGAQIDRVKQELSDQGLLAEDWGGDVVMVPVSAKQKTNLDLLLEMILLVADMKELKANPKRLAGGVVLEAKLDKGRGCVATVIVQNGTLELGDSFVAGSVHGRVRALINDRGVNIQSAGPSIPVEIQGLQDLPLAGDTFQVFEDATKARQVAEYRQAKEREQTLRKSSRLSLQALYEQMREGTVKELSLIVKCDVQGSVEVLTEVLNKLSSEKVKVKILHSGAGAITETDVLLASASNAIIIGFNVRPERKAQDLADSEGVEIRSYTVIYNLANDIRAAMIGMLEYTTHEKYVGRAEVRDTFRVPKFGSIAGSYVLDGVIQRNAEARLLRDNAVIHEGKISSLRRFKDDVSEVKSGFECGIGFERFSDVKVGDIIEAYVIEKVQPTSL